MTEQLEYAVFESQMGWVGLLGSTRGLLQTTLPQPSAEQARYRLGKQVDYTKQSHNLFHRVIERLQSYCKGIEEAFPDELDLSDATPFERQVWEVTRLIPYGATRSYKWVAEQIGKPGASRAVGQALARNPLPIIIPCHRVLNANGRLGGFSGGLEMKRRLLNLEARH